MKKCPLAQAHNRGAIREEHIEAVQNCDSAKKQSNFAKQFCQPYKHKKQIQKIMLNAYEDWHQRQMFTKGVTITYKKSAKKKKATKVATGRVLSTF